ncbi:molybdopterin molybdotransferase MoeA [Qipengyuania nanhaisediminis]|uniref:molybdopterin molybdotransferase MoeA n=1 Tax=Qipengyuania nanhaisediminis TaxID=604088 RepID=UPI0038B286E2
MSLLALEQAQERLLALAPELGSETVPSDRALGRVLAAGCTARRAQPPFDVSAMDGFALRGHGPWRCVGESRAGAPFEGALEPGQCTRISTGAAMPDGADRVLIREDAAVEHDRVSTAADPVPGQHVRKRGFDFGVGERVLASGEVITPARLALALASGHGELPVVRATRVAVIECGDELARDPADCAPHQVPACNGAMVAGLLAPLACEVERLGPVGDDPAALARSLEEARYADIVITIGGASVGDHDHVRGALADWGANIAFWKVAIKPGKPLLVASRQAGEQHQVVLGLPGNPVSSFVTAFLFALPLVRRANGMADTLPESEPAILGEDLPATGTRRSFLRGIWSAGEVRLAASQDSSALHALARANCLIDRPAGAAPSATGDTVRVLRLQNG